MISPETRMMELRYGEEIMIVGRTAWTQSTSVTDGQTDRTKRPCNAWRRAVKCSQKIMKIGEILKQMYLRRKPNKNCGFCLIQIYTVSGKNETIVF